MILVDTSVWVRFLAGREPFARTLDALLDREELLGHELVYGELLVGDRRDRSRLLAEYELLARAPTLPHREVVTFVRARKLQGRGIGWIDVHLLASALVASAQVWTADARLDAVAGDLGLSYELA
jgi:predicted nucleic acid-binding protein